MNLWPYRSISSSSATIFGVDYFGRKWARWNPIRALYRAFRWLDDLKWSALHRWHPSHRYNIVRTGLAPGYYDEDERMLYACMGLLCEFVDCQEGPDALDRFTKELGEEPDPNAPEGWGKGQINTQSEATAIYRWWKIDRPANQQRREEMLMRIYGDDKAARLPGDSHETFAALERQNDADDQAMLHRLIDIRRGLWT